jgi:hypothetical protein
MVVGNTGFVSTGVVLCPESGCTTPAQLIATNKYLSIAGFDGSSVDVFYSYSYSAAPYVTSIQRCTAPVAGQCGAKPTVESTLTSSVLVATDSTLFYEAPYGDAGLTSFYAVAVTDSGNLGTPLGFGSTSYPHYYAYGTDMYVYSPGPTCKILKCPATGCSGGLTAVLSLPNSASEFAVDASGYYWLDGNSNIQMCPLTGCGAGPKLVAAGLTSPHLLRLVGGFVYWVDQTTPTSGTIKRIAKP